MRNLSRRKKNNIIIASLCAIVVLMGIGYAAFSSQLRINGTSSISSNWDIRITNIETMLPSEMGDGDTPDGYNISEPTYTPSSATFNAGFELPGSMIYYVVEVSNMGSLDAQVTIGNLNCGDNENIMCMTGAYDVNPMEDMPTNGIEFDYGNQDYSGVNFPLKTNEKHYIMIMVGYDDVTEQPTDLDASIKLDLTYEQYVDPNAPVFSGETTTIGGQEVNLVSSGDGLYEDEYEIGRYIYKGASPNNYIAFGNEATEYRVIYQGQDIGVSFDSNGECENWLTESGAPDEVSCTATKGYSGGLWRIVAKEVYGTYKIVKNEIIGKISFDSQGTRGDSGSTYCYNDYSYGCNVWASTANMVGTPQYFTNGTTTGLVLSDSTLNKFLNTDYWNILDSSIREYIVTSHNWNIGAVGYYDNINELIAKETSYQWNGSIGLISPSDYLKANSNMELCGTNEIIDENYEICQDLNWMYIPNTWWWTISPYDSSVFNVATVHRDGYIIGNQAYVSNGVRPAVYLSSSIILEGEGTESNPFKIIS